MIIIDNFKYSKLTFDCEWKNLPWRPLSPLYWRDRIEWQFKKICCITIKRQCHTCAVSKGCMVSFLFKPEYWFEGKRPFKGSIPLPWVPGYPSLYTDKNFTLSLVLMGTKAISQLPYWFVVIEQIGKGRGPGFTVKSVYSDTSAGKRALYNADGESLLTDPGITEPENFSCIRKLRMDFLTPARLLFQKKPLLTPACSHIIDSIARRGSTLSEFYGDAPLPHLAPEVRACAAAVKATPVNLQWQERVIYSKKQKETMSLSGLTGSLLLEGNFEPFSPLLGLGEHIGIGKGTALGLGRYEIQVS
ncbi:MAG: CRISPR system precrRNA processing endoribonuclease RAMP protein Cas6 [Pseudomonadota bacterium]